MKNKLALIVGGLSLAMFATHWYWSAISPAPGNIKAGIHLSFAFALLALYQYQRKAASSGKLYKVGLFVLLGLALVSTLRYLYLSLPGFIDPTLVTSPSALDLGLGILTIIIVLLGASMTIGPPIVVVTVAFIAYALLGQFIPGIMGHSALTWRQFVAEAYLVENGIFGSMTQVSVSTIFGIVVVGGLLGATGGGKAFLNVAANLFGRFTGGPAKVAVVGSALFGMVSGSALASVATIGNFTIPLMKRNGFEPEYAGAVESVGSTGAQLMPPIMGLTAFVMPQLIGIPYATIALAATLPAIMYYVALFTQVHLHAKKLDIKALPGSSFPSLRRSLKDAAPAFLAIGIFIFMLAVVGWSVEMSASWLTVLMIIGEVVQGLLTTHRLNLSRVYQGIQDGVKTGAGIAVLLACIGVVISAVDATGVGGKLANGLVSLAGGSTILLLILAMIASLILGMGLPTIVCYLLLAVFAAPAMVKGGIPILPAHLFIFYFGCLSAITPPVCAASYTAAVIAQAKMLRTAIKACLLAFSGLVIPYFFAYSPALLLVGSTPLQILLALARCAMAVVAIAIGFEGYFLNPLRVPARLLFLGGGLLLLFPQIYLTSAGALIVISVGGLVYFMHASKKPSILASHHEPSHT